MQFAFNSLSLRQWLHIAQKVEDPTRRHLPFCGGGNGEIEFRQHGLRFVLK